MKRIAWALGTLGLVSVLSTPAGAESKRTYFTTVEEQMGGPTIARMLSDGQKVFQLGAESAFTETATDPRVTGHKVITWDAVFDLPALSGRMWGRSRLELADGAWDGYWTGIRTAFTDADGTPHVRTTIISVATGSGAFEGLAVRWDISGVDADQGIPMTGSGYITEANDGPDGRPMRWSSGGTESIDLHPVMVLPPSDPPVFGMVATWNIGEEVGQATHLGRLENAGFGVLDLTTGRVTGSGCATSASGDWLFWVATGTSLGPSGPVDLALNWAGGSGRLADAVGQVNGCVSTESTSTGEWTSLAEFSFSGTGIIRY